MASDIGSGGAGNMAVALADFKVASAQTDGPTDQKETAWGNVNWDQWYGDFKNVPEYNTVVTKLGTWVTGKGFKADEETTELLKGYRGNGTDTFNGILKNGVMVSEVGGDFFAEIIRNDGAFKKLFTWFGFTNPGKPVNLKPLDPGTIMIISDGKGFIKRYEQISKNYPSGKNKIIKVENMFHVPRDRFADNVHGTSLTEKLRKKMLALGESLDDYKQVQHRFVKPRWIIKLNTDNKAKIDAEKVKWDKANDTGDNMYIPMGSVEVEQMAIGDKSTLSPLDWQASLKDSFYEDSGVPKIIVGNAGGQAEAGVKVVYMGFEQTIEEKQLFWEEQTLAQLGLEIELEFPVRMEQANNSPQETEAKEGNENKPSDTTASMPGNK